MKSSGWCSKRNAQQTSLISMLSSNFGSQQKDVTPVSVAHVHAIPRMQVKVQIRLSIFHGSLTEYVDVRIRTTSSWKTCRQKLSSRISWLQKSALILIGPFQSLIYAAIEVYRQWFPKVYRHLVSSLPDVVARLIRSSSLGYSFSSPIISSVIICARTGY